MKNIRRRKDWGKLSPSRTFGPLYVECAGFGISRRLADALAREQLIVTFGINDQHFVTLESLRALAHLAECNTHGEQVSLQIPSSEEK